MPGEHQGRSVMERVLSAPDVQGVGAFSSGEGGMLSRKAIHLASGLMLLALPLWGYGGFQRLVWIAFAVAIGVEGLRRTSVGRRMFNRVLGVMLKEREREGAITDAFWHLLASALLVTFFSPDAAVAGFLLLVFADTAAWWAGRHGRIRIHRKSLEGSLAFAATGLLLLSLLPGASPVRVGATVLVATLVEHGVDRDNLWVPLAGALVWMLGGG